MSQGTNLYTRLRFIDKTYNSKDEVLGDYNYVTDRIRQIKFRLFVFAMMTEPDKFKSDDESAEFYIKSNVNDLLEEYETLIVEHYKLEMLLERWDKCHDENNGLAIDPPKDIKYGHYMDGDFVYTVKCPTNKELLS
jgi:hypothetical protein